MWRSKFVVAMLVAVAVSQTTAQVAVTDADVARVKNWITGQQTESLGKSQDKQEIGRTEELEDAPGFTASISYDTTLIGVNFVTMQLDVFGGNRTAFWAKNSTFAVYFQIEEPTTTSASRLLGASTSKYEGWLGAWINPGEEKAGKNQTMAVSKNLYGSTSLVGNNQHFSTLGGVEAVNTTSTSIWQFTSRDVQEWTLPHEVPCYDYCYDYEDDPEAEEEEPEMTLDNMRFQVYRMTNSAHFEIKTWDSFNAQAGVRWWPASSKKGDPAKMYGDVNGSFMFTGAVQALASLSAVTALALF